MKRVIMVLFITVILSISLFAEDYYCADEPYTYFIYKFIQGGAKSPLYNYIFNKSSSVITGTPNFLALTDLELLDDSLETK